MENIKKRLFFLWLNALIKENNKIDPLRNKYTFLFPPSFKDLVWIHKRLFFNYFIFILKVSCKHDTCRDAIMQNLNLKSLKYLIRQNVSL